MEYDYEAFMKALGARVKDLRKKRGWSQRDMVVTHGYHDTQWRKTERGRGLSIPSLLKLASLFGMPVCELLAGLCEDMPQAPKVASQKTVKVKKLSSNASTASANHGKSSMLTEAKKASSQR